MTTLDDLLARDGMSRADLPKTGRMGALVRAEGVAPDGELARVLALPRRAAATEAEIEFVSAHLRQFPQTDICLTCGGVGGTDEDPCKVCGGTGKIRLKANQVEALRELFECRGLFGSMRVGSGKTLVTLLAATLLGSQRPVLMIPGSLREKTQREFAVLHAAWKVRLPTLISYQEMGRPDRDGHLLTEAPDLLLLDEAHHARNLDAAVTRRIKRAIELLRPVVAMVSGTLMTGKILDYHHHATWSLGQGAPLPLSPAKAEEWGQATDKEVGMLKRMGAGRPRAAPRRLRRMVPRLAGGRHHSRGRLRRLDPSLDLGTPDGGRAQADDRKR